MIDEPQSTKALVGCVSDLEGSPRFCSAEASRRLGSSWVLSLEARTFSNVDAGDPLCSYRHDDYAQWGLAWYFQIAHLVGDPAATRAARG